MNWRVTIGNKQTNKQPNDPRASLLSVTNKALFCNIRHLWSVVQPTNQSVRISFLYEIIFFVWMFCTTTMFVSPVHDVPAQGCWWLSGASGKHLWHWPSVRRGPLRKKITSQGQQHAGRGCKNNPIIILGHAPLSGHDGGNPWLSSGKICVPRAWAGAIV